MNKRIGLTDIIEKEDYHKILAIAVIVLLFLELAIYLGAAGQVGRESWVMVYDKQGNRIYETPGEVMTSYEKLVFEETFGPLDNYRVAVESKHEPFPFRGWLATAVGAPVGLVLLLAFVVRAYLALMSGDDETEEEASENGLSSSRSGAFTGSFFDIFRRLSVFHLGFLAVIVVLALWLVPNLAVDFSKAAVAIVLKFKWFFLGVSVFFGSLVVWLIYLRYRLSQKMLDDRLELEKFQLEKRLTLEQQGRKAIPSAPLQSEREDEESAIAYWCEETSEGDSDCAPQSGDRVEPV